MIEDGKKVRIHYKGTLSDGEIFDSSEGRDPLEFETGSGMVIPGFDSAVRNMEVGGKKTVTLPAAEAYGEIREEMVGDIPRTNFPEGMELQVGMPLQMQGPQGPLPVLWSGSLRAGRIRVRLARRRAATRARCAPPPRGRAAGRCPAPVRAGPRGWCSAARAPCPGPAFD